MDKIKIIYCIHSTYSSGGMERVLSNKVNYLADLPNYEVYIITTEQKGRPHFYNISSKVICIDLGVNYLETAEDRLPVKILKSIKKYYQHKSRLKKVLFQLRANIVISMFNNDVSFLYKINDGSKKVLEIHFCREFRMLADRKGFWKLLDIYKTYSNDKLVKNYDSFVVLTHEDKQSWKSDKNIRVIYNPLPKSEIKISNLSNKNILAIGRSSHQKNFELLIEIWNEISTLHPDWTLSIVGPGDFTSVINKIHEYSLIESVKIFPATDSIENFYNKSSIYLMTSRYEGFPMVLVEAQNFGLPIVAFDCKCGPKEIINNNLDGFLIDNLDKVNFVLKVSQLIKNDQMRMEYGKNAKENSYKFSEAEIMKKWTVLFEELLSN